MFFPVRDCGDAQDGCGERLAVEEGPMRRESRKALEIGRSAPGRDGGSESG